ncbi:HNH endonuclease signature motif containing protein [Homoserinimonas sp. A520]
MSSSVTVFEDEVDQLIESFVSSLETVLPAGALRPVSDDTLLVTTGHLERLGRVVDARRVEAAGELQHRSRPTLGSASLAVRKGCRDAVELLRRVTLGSTATVRRRVKLGAGTRVQEALSGDLFPPRFPHLAAALEKGAIGVDAAGAIITELSPTLVRADVADVQRAEAELVAAATGTSPDSPIACTAEEIRGQATVWRVFLDQDGTTPTEEKAMGRRMFSPGSFNSGDGLVHGRYVFLPEVHARLEKVFDACLTPKTGPAFLPESDEQAGPTDTRTADQQRHDVMAAMIDGFARSGQAPTIGGASPTVLVSVTADTLGSGHGAGYVSLGGPGGETVPLSLRAVHQMICTGGTQQVTLDPNGAIINLGTELRCFTAHQRRAITLRDGGCIIPGCTIPPAWTEIHHVTPDAEGGPTHTDNGVLLCWFHHRTITTSGWDIKMINNIPHVKAPTWLRGDGLWHPATKSPTQHSQRLRHKPRRQERPPKPVARPPETSQTSE